MKVVSTARLVNHPNPSQIAKAVISNQDAGFNPTSVPKALGGLKTRQEYGRSLMNSSGMTRKMVRMIEAESGRVVVARMERADTLWKQTIGLLGRDALEADSGLWLEPCNSVHTFGMRFSIDVLFLNRKGVAIKTAHRIVPYRIAGLLFQAHIVVELPSGILEAQNIVEGHRYFLE